MPDWETGDRVWLIDPDTGNETASVVVSIKPFKIGFPDAGGIWGITFEHVRGDEYRSIHSGAIGLIKTRE